MLDRVLEPEVMDSPDEAREYDAMDHAEVNRRFVTDLLALVGEPAGEWGEVLDLGAGTAQIPIELCRRSERWRVTAIDLSVPMLDLARGNIEVAGLMHRIRLDRLDAKALPFDDARFDVVMSNSIVHHLAEPAPHLAEAVRLLAPGGAIFYRDLLRPTDRATLDRLVDQYGGPAERGKRLFAESLHAALALDEIRRLVADLGFAPDTVQATSDRHWTFAARRA